MHSSGNPLFAASAVRGFHRNGTLPATTAIFVFGSNDVGVHGAGAAKAAARLYGAVRGIAEGRQGRSYAIPTREKIEAFKFTLRTLPVAAIVPAIERFVAYANAHPDLSFHVTRIGCGLAGHADNEIAPHFANAPANCSFAEEWAPFLSFDPVEKHAETEGQLVRCPRDAP